MANVFEHKDRRVVPNWRSFRKTAALGEIASIYKKDESTGELLSISDYITDWKNYKTTTHASELLSAALINNFKENDDVHNAATFILDHYNQCSRSQILLAKTFIEPSGENDISKSFKEITSDSLPHILNPEPIWTLIKDTKKYISIYPFNPIAYVELSRHYSILGLEEQSIRAMKTALHLAPNNRFVLRCATRLFAHYHSDQNNYLDYIHSFLRKSPLTIEDPWLISAEISIATIRKRTSKFIKRGIELIHSRNISPFNFTELASSLGTVELLYGSSRKSRELFDLSLINPNDNSLAQVEWASTKDKRIEINPIAFSVKLNFEALALDNYHNGDFVVALDNAVKWFKDMPFSKRPIMFGSNLASTILKDQKSSVAFLNAGLISHPNDPQIINNMAYAFALDNNPQESFNLLQKIRNLNDIDTVTQICLTATKGLTYFRMGLPDVGRKLYLEAIEQTTKNHNKELNHVAILNYAREEIKANSEFVHEVMEAVSSIPTEGNTIEVKVLKNDVLDLYEKSKQQ